MNNDEDEYEYDYDDGYDMMIYECSGSDSDIDVTMDVNEQWMDGYICDVMCMLFINKLIDII